MKVIFEELVKGNLPKKEEEKEEFSVVKGEEYYYLYHLGNPSRDMIIKFSFLEANSEIIEERCKKIFEFFRYRLNEETRKWEQIK